MLPLPDIDFLRHRHRMIHFFGLGFVQVKMASGPVDRYHFYHPSLPAITESPHNHRYDFRASVLKGELIQSIWLATEAGFPNATVLDESCTPDKEGSAEGRRTYAYVRPLADDITTRVGSSYFLDRDAFHTVAHKGITITALQLGPKLKTHAQVIQLDGVKNVCPFSVQLAEDRLWEIVESCIYDEA